MRGSVPLNFSLNLSQNNIVNEGFKHLIKEIGSLKSSLTRSTPVDGSGKFKSLLSYKVGGIGKEGVSYYYTSVNLYLSLLPNGAAEQVKQVMEMLQIYPIDSSSSNIISQEYVSNTCKKLNVFLLQNRERFSPYWDKMMDLNHNLPWVEVSNDGIQELYDQVVEDFSTAPVTRNDEQYLKAFLKYSENWVSAGKLEQFRKTPTLEQFLQAPAMWATPGSSVEKGVLIETEMGIQKTQKSKWSLSFKFNPQQLYNIMFADKRTEVNISIKKKEKPPKLRSISTVSLEDYLCESYIAIYLEQRRKMGSNFTSYKSPLNATLNQNVNNIQNWISYLEAEAYSIDTDATSFDVHYTLEENVAFFTSIKNIATKENWPNLQSIIKCIDTVISRAIKTPKIKFTPNNKYIQYIKGLLSGKRTTAIQGTNKSSVVANMCIDAAGVREELIDCSTNGDDTNLFFRTKTALNKYYDMLKEMNAIKINDTKTLTSPMDVDSMRIATMEYLKVIYTNKPKKIRTITEQFELHGYGLMARSMTSILLRSPESNSDKRTALSIVNNWLRVYQRGGVMVKVTQHMTRDLIGYFRNVIYADEDLKELEKSGIKINKQLIHDWLGTPKSAGGAGLGGQLVPMTLSSNWIRVTEQSKLVNPNFKIKNKGTWAHWNIEDKVLQNNFGATFGLTMKTDKYMSKLSFVNYNRIMPMKLTHNGLSYNVGFKPETFNMGSFLIDDWIEKYSKQWRSNTWRLKEILDSPSYTIVEMVRNKWTRSCFISWLKGTLWTEPTVAYMSPNLTSVATDDYKARLFNVLIRLDTNAATLLRANLQMEDWSRTISYRYRYLYGS